MSNRLYTSIPAPKVPRNTFDLSSPNSLTMPFQRCVPTRLMEILPGDFVRMGSETFARLQPLQAPVMNNMKISNHAFYIPLRTLNDHVAEFLWNNENGDYSEVMPYITLHWIFEAIFHVSGSTEANKKLVDVIRLLDFIGLPFRYEDTTEDADEFVALFLNDEWNRSVGESSNRVNLLPFFAYTKVWNEYFRDENVQEKIDFSVVRTWTGNVEDLLPLTQVDDIEDFLFTFMRLRPRAWQHDRFTSSLPFAQRGPDVLLPIAGSADVTYKDGYLLGDVTPLRSGKVVVRDGYPVSELKGNLAKNDSQNLYMGGTGAGGVNTAAYDPNGSLEVNFDNAELATTINDFRRAERLQRWFENSARGGVRPNEATLAHFGVKTPDASLDRSEFLGGYMQPIVVSEVAQTSETTDNSPQGTLAGKGTTYKGNALFRRYFTEHGFVFVFTSALVRANYWQGIPKVFSRMQRDEYYWPEFANLGEEPVFSKELFATASEDSVFGYVPRYSDYKSSCGELHGNMRSTLDFWTQPREFANEPRLNEEFIFGYPSLSPFAVQSEFADPIIVTIQFNVRASRLMPFYGVPTI